MAYLGTYLGISAVTVHNIALDIGLSTKKIEHQENWEDFRKIQIDLGRAKVEITIRKEGKKALFQSTPEVAEESSQKQKDFAKAVGDILELPWVRVFRSEMSLDIVWGWAGDMVIGQLRN